MTRLTFYVTGFGPFHGVESNPTTVLVERLRDYVGGDDDEFLHDEDEDRPGTRDVAVRVRSAVLETSVEGVEVALRHMFDGLNITNSKNNDDDVTVLLHLGVARHAKTVRLERRAYNEASFRVPDERGRRPDQACIVAERALGHRLHTTLDLASLHEELCAAPPHEKKAAPEATVAVELSVDPGRFVCNYTYYTSLSKAAAVTPLQPPQQPQPRIHVLFVHVPPFSQIDEHRQFSFLLRLLKSIQRQLVQ